MSWFSKGLRGVWNGIQGVLGIGGNGKGVTVVIQPPVVVETEESIAREKYPATQLAGIDTNLIFLIGIPVILYFMLRKK